MGCSAAKPVTASRQDMVKLRRPANPLERHREIGRGSDVIGISPNDAVLMSYIRVMWMGLKKKAAYLPG